MPILIGKKSKNVMEHLATEEYLLRHYDLKEDILYLWFGSKAFVFGRNQNPFIEIHPKYLNDSKITKLRRISGGGTIYEDEGTFNFSLITNQYKHRINDYQYFLQPLIDLLNRLGLNVKFTPKSHLFIDDKKISGNAQAFVNNRMMHHGTILFDTDLSIVEEALVNHQIIVKGNQVLSNKQKVMNISEHIGLDKNQFAIKVIEAYHEAMPISMLELSDLDQDKIQELIKTKYQQWSWNFGKTPSFNITINDHNKPVELTIEKGFITKMQPMLDQSWIGQRFNPSNFDILKESNH